MSLDTHEIDRVMRALSAGGNLVAPFLGAFPSDLAVAARFPRQRWCCVFNYSPAAESGTHWVSMVYQPESAYWFDSFGLEPDFDSRLLGTHTRFSQFLADLGVQHLRVNQFDYQDLHAASCGEWACRALLREPMPPPEVIGGSPYNSQQAEKWIAAEWKKMEATALAASVAAVRL